MYHARNSGEHQRIDGHHGSSTEEPKEGITTDQMQSEDSDTRSNDVEAERTKAPVAPANVVDASSDGNLIAWMQVSGSFFLNMNSWGIVNSFGVFQVFYQSGELFHESPSNISWIGSTQGFLLLFVGVVVGPMYDAGHFKMLIRLGAFLTVFGLMMTSICTEYWQVMLAQGVCIGFGSACLFVPSFAIIPQYFNKRRALATGFGASGSSFGGVIFPLIFHGLQPMIGFAWATRVIGFVALAGFAVSLSVMKVKVIPKQKRALLEPKAFKEAAYSFFCAGAFFAFVGLYAPIFYISAYASQFTNQDLAFHMLTILNAASLFGRTVPNYFADKLGPFNMLIFCGFLSAILCFGWIGVKSTPALIVFATLYGFASGSFVSLPPTAIVQLTPDMRLIGTRMGMCFGISSFGILVGSPLAGAILNKTGNYLETQLVAGSMILAAAICLLISRLVRYGWKFAVKA